MSGSKHHRSLGREWKLIQEQDFAFISDRNAALLLRTPRGARLLLFVILLFFCTAIYWLAYTEIEELVIGSGKVIPSQQLQVLQSLEGGIVAQVLVNPGELVNQGDVLLRIDNTQFESNLGEISKKITILMASEVRLRAQLEGVEPVFSPWLRQDIPDIVSQENKLYRSLELELGASLAVFDNQMNAKRQEAEALQSDRIYLQQSIDLLQQELAISEPLLDVGAISEVEILNIKKKLNDLDGELSAIDMKLPLLRTRQVELSEQRSAKSLSFQNDVRTQLNTVLAELETIKQTRSAAQDRVSRTAIQSPVKGTVQRVLASTISSVVKPGMDLIEIVPLDDDLVMEVKIRPSDIGFLSQGQRVMVKFTAYDFVIYGGLSGELEHISADAIADEKESYYLAKVRTDSNYLNVDGEAKRLIPGMTVSVDIVTGERSILSYLIKPILRAKHYALHER
ncbi:MAG: HlyD family type I secretion periplasmic adaptor subunit [Gammaproteobacteria bacterium]|nr:HlyD family type I secretion periplasmic adaptor subunit [Gammaproteobacteria bacterium]